MSSIVRALDVNGDWTFGKGRNDFKLGRDAIAQTIGTRLYSFLGDCFFDTGAGIDWFTLLGGKNQLAIELSVTATILNTPDVTSIIELSAVLDRRTRRLTITYTVNTVSGVITSTVEVTSATFMTTETGDTLTTEDGDDLITEGP